MDELGQRTGRHRSQQLAVRTDLGATGAAEITVAANLYWLDGDALALSEPGHALAYCGNLTGELVAESHIRRTRKLSPIEVEVAAADAATTDADEYAARFERRDRDVLNLELLGASDDSSLHRGVSDHAYLRLVGRFSSP
jgi:hypothetical protein